MNTKRITSILMAVAMLAMVMVAQSNPANAEGSNGSPIEGSWRTTVSIDGFSDFDNIFSFASGGVLIVADSSQLSPPSGTNAQGVWEKIGRKSYAYTFVMFLFDTANDFTPAGELRVWGVITLDGKDAYTTTDQFEFLDLDGNVTFAGCATQRATRMTVASLTSCPGAASSQALTIDNRSSRRGWRMAHPGEPK